MMHSPQLRNCFLALAFLEMLFKNPFVAALVVFFFSFWGVGWGLASYVEPMKKKVWLTMFCGFEHPWMASCRQQSLLVLWPLIYYFPRVTMRTSSAFSKQRKERKVDGDAIPVLFHFRFFFLPFIFYLGGVRLILSLIAISSDSPFCLVRFTMLLFFVGWGGGGRRVGGWIDGWKILSFHVC